MNKYISSVFFSKTVENTLYRQVSEGLDYIQVSKFRVCSWILAEAECGLNTKWLFPDRSLG